MKTHFIEIIKKNKKNIFFFCMLIVLITAVYGQSLRYGFTYFDDDVLVLHNHEFISDYKNIPKFFTKPAFYASSGSLYRPVLTLSFAIDAMIAGTNPFMYHLTGVLLHIACVFLLFVFLKKFKFNEIFVFLFTALFAVHPAFTPAVVWIPGRNDLLLAVFVLAAMIFLSDYYEGGKKSAFKVIFALCMFAGALFTKESAAAMIVVMPVFMFLFCKNVSKKDCIKVFAASVLIFCLYMFLRCLALPYAASARFDVVAAAKAVLNYCEYSVIPVRIYLFPEKIPVDFLTYSAVFLFFTPLCFSLFLNTGRKRVVLFGAFWFFVFLAPSLITPNPVFSVLPHRLYAAFAGFIIIQIEFFGALSEKFVFFRKYAVFLLAVFIVMFAPLSYFQTKNYKNKYVFFTNAITEQPDSETLRLKMAEYYADIRDFEKAKNEISMIKSNEGKYSFQYYEILGYIYSLEGKYENAAVIFEQLHDLFPFREAVINNLSEIYFLKGEYAKALEYNEKLIALRPEKSIYKEQYAKIINNMTAPEKIKNPGKEKIK